MLFLSTFSKTFFFAEKSRFELFDIDDQKCLKMRCFIREISKSRPFFLMPEQFSGVEVPILGDKIFKSRYLGEKKSFLKKSKFFHLSQRLNNPKMKRYWESEQYTQNGIWVCSRSPPSEESLNNRIHILLNFKK